jgi:hypothetical protein
LELVREGMLVVDVDGREVGEVSYAQMGDPEAVTTCGNPPAVTSLAGSVSVDGAEPDVPEPLRSRLLRHGFVKVDGPTCSPPTATFGPTASSESKGRPCGWRSAGRTWPRKCRGATPDRPDRPRRPGSSRPLSGQRGRRGTRRARALRPGTLRSSATASPVAA